MEAKNDGKKFTH